MLLTYLNIRELFYSVIAWFLLYNLYDDLHINAFFRAYGFMSFVIDVLSAQPILSLYFRVVNLGEGIEELSVRIFHTARLLPLLRKGGLKMAMEFIERCLEVIL